MNWLYLGLNLFAISFPLARSFEPRIRYASRWKSLFPAIIITGAFFLIWDVLFTKTGVWGFNDDYLVGIRIFGLPIEEWFFFISVPFASVFIYDCVKYFLPSLKSSQLLRIATLAFAAGLILIAWINSERAYTFWNLLFGGSYLAIIAILNPTWLAKFWVGYLIHLLPFLLVNSVLTGSFIDEPVVWYENAENLGIRIFTIPVEDTIYALLLLLMNCSIYEWINKYFSLRTYS